MGGEVDIMERLNYDSIVYQTVHSHYTYTLGIENNDELGAGGDDKRLGGEAPRRHLS